MKFRCWTCVFLSALLMTAIAFGQNQNNGRQRTGPRVIADHLDNPSGVAVHPETGHIFVAQHPGVLRVMRNEQGRGYTSKTEISQYPSDIYGKGPMYNIGPLGVAILDEDHLVVGDGSRPDGQELIRIYKISESAPAQPQMESAAVATLGPIEAGDASAKGEGNFYGVAVTDSAIFATSNGDDTKGWIVRAKRDGDKTETLTPFIATKEILQVDAPCGITINKEGDLVVSQMGEINVPKDSLLTVYDAETGKLKAKYQTDLNDIIGLAYSPEGKLYAVDFSWMDPSQGGLFELTIDGDKCTSRKLMSLDKPTALAFDKEGALLITVFGTAAEGSDEKPGQLLRLGQRRLNQL